MFRLLTALLATLSAAVGSAASPPLGSATDVERVSAPQACTVTLRDTPQYGLAPMPPKLAAVEQPRMEAQHWLTWNRTARITFHTCPPTRALFIGDSLTFSLGLAIQYDEQRYGVELANAAILGCAFGNRGRLNISGKWSPQPPGCAGALGQWVREERAFRPAVVVIELGYRDQFDWRWNGTVVHLGQPRFDAYVRQRVDKYVQALSGGGARLLFLSVPWTHPRNLPNGSPAPAGDPARHRIINTIIRSVVARYPGRARLLDIDQVVSPGNRYRERLNGKLCRFDGVHFAIDCGALLRAPVLGAVASLARG